jgi:hypothetical protein
LCINRILVDSTFDVNFVRGVAHTVEQPLRHGSFACYACISKCSECSFS